MTFLARLNALWYYRTERRRDYHGFDSPGFYGFVKVLSNAAVIQLSSIMRCILLTLYELDALQSRKIDSLSIFLDYKPSNMRISLRQHAA